MTAADSDEACNRAMNVCLFIGNVEMGFRLFKKREPSRGELIRDLARELAKNESGPPPDFITELALANGQTPDGALAEYYALTFSALTYALWASLGTQEKVFPILDVLQPIFVQSLSSDCKRIFLEIATLREQMYVKTIHETLKSADTSRAIRLSSSTVARITGHYDERLGMEQLQPDCLDIAVLTGLWKLITDQIVITMKLMNDLQKNVPGLFSDPID